MLSSYFILSRPLLLLPPIPPSIRVFSNESMPRSSLSRVQGVRRVLMPCLSGLFHMTLSWMGWPRESLEFCMTLSWVGSPVLAPSISTLHMRWPKYWSFSFSIIPSKEIQGWSPSEWTGCISLQSKGLSRVFSSTIIWKHQFFGAQPSFWSNSHIHRWLLEKS